MAVLLVGMTSPARGEDGLPGVVKPFDDGDVVPTNALIPLAGENGVPFGLAELAALQPRLVRPSGTIPLYVVDSFDDLEGHAKPFPSDGGGYGENLILLAPQSKLAPSSRYALTIGTGKGQAAYFDVSTGAGADTKAPEWQRAPFLELMSPEADGPTLPSHIVTALAEPAELPLYFIVDLEPREPVARPKRMIVALHLPSAGDRDCGFVRVWDHQHGVYAEDTDSDLGRRYVAKLTAVDAAGNRRRAPGSGVPIVWSGGIAVCNVPGALPRAGPEAPAPRWLGKPTHASSVDAEFKPSDDHGTESKHSLTLPVETTTVAVVELDIRRLSSAGTSYRRVALLWPTKGASPTSAPPRPGKNCVEPLITNQDREKPMPSKDESVSVRIAIIDALGRRLGHPGPPFTVGKLHPDRSRIQLCATASVSNSPSTRASDSQ